jgi:hypothetical protein
VDNSRKRFIPPTLDEVRRYCAERKNRVDPQKWMDHYESNGWRVGRNPMRSWQAAVRTWERMPEYGAAIREPPPPPARPEKRRDCEVCGDTATAWVGNNKAARCGKHLDDTPIPGEEFRSMLAGAFKGG